MKRQRDFHYTDENFQRVVKLINERAGICLSDRKSDMVYSRLARRLRKLGFTDFDSYLDYVEQDPEEEVDFTNALTTNLTHFFRENHHFEYLSQEYLPELIEQGQKRIRIWSAGCSTGEEPYSMALVWKLAFAKFNQLDFKILATDLDTNVLEACKRGIYNQEKIKNIDSEYKSWFKRTKRCSENEIEIYPKLRDFIFFKQLNLMGDWPMKGPLDVIICRNVLIYFDKETQQKLVERFASLLSVNGCLILGHSENLSTNKATFESLGKTIFRKKFA